MLVIKIAWGGKSLAEDFRPPSAGGEVGPYYTELFAHLREVLDNLASHFPALAGRGYEIAGFGWHQGWNDRINQAFNDAYEENLSHFIRDVRRELGIDDLPFVIAETGMAGRGETHPRALSLMRAQAAVANREEFQGNVAFVGTKDFYRPPEESPTGQVYHWNGNAETYCRIGGGMARAMLELVDRSAGTANPQSYLKAITELLDEQWPRNRTVHIVCHGHSVPAGYFKTPVVEPFSSYPHLLHRELQSRHPHAVLNVIVTAIGGETSAEGALRFARDVLPHRPDVITLDYGLNDRRIGLEKARAAWASMIEAALAADVRILLLTPTPDLGADIEDPEDPLNQHARQIRELAARYQVGLVDSLAAFERAARSGTRLADLMSQQNHPNHAGHRLVTGELLRWFPNSNR